MIDLINVPIKNDGDELSAQEFNLVVSGTNSAISQLNLNSEIDKVIWLSGDTKPVIVADTIIGELEEGDTHYITTYTENENKIAIINNINKFYPIYNTYSNLDLSLYPYILLQQNNNFVGVDYNSSRLYRLSSGLTLDDTFNNADYAINDIKILSDNSILLCTYDNNNDNNIIFKLDSDGNIDQTFETIIYSGDTELHDLFSIQSSDKIIAILEDWDTLADDGACLSSVIRFNLDGTVDTTFDDYFFTGHIDSEIITTSDDSIITIINSTLVKLNSGGTEDITFDFTLTGITTIFNCQLSNGGFFVKDNNYNYIYKINSDGTADETFNVNFSEVIDDHYNNLYIDPYVPLIIENGELVLVTPTSDTTSDILRIGVDGTLVSATSIDVGSTSYIFKSNQSTYTVSAINENTGEYSGLYLYDSNFNRIFTTYIEKSHNAKQSDLDGLKFKYLLESQYQVMLSGGTLDSSTIYFRTNN